ncbi:family 3, member A protein-like protein [Camelus ferus]|nr:family 3, member A protein-like protein [Camelus ferus]
MGFACAVLNASRTLEKGFSKRAHAADQEDKEDEGQQGTQDTDTKKVTGGPLRIVALVIAVGLTWIVVSILLGGPGSGFPRIQQLFAKPRARRYKCGLPQPCPEEHLAFRMVSGAANVIGPKICLEDKMLMSSVKDNVGRGLNIALVNGVSGELIEARAFDMWAGDVNDLLKFIRPLHEGTLVFVASYDDPATKMNEETRKLFSDLGSKNVKDLAFRDSWVFVGAKGVQNKSPFEQLLPCSSPTQFPGTCSPKSGGSCPATRGIFQNLFSPEWLTAL